MTVANDTSDVPALDGKLKEILQANLGYASMSDNYFITQIKQAFADEGYMTARERVEWHEEHFNQNHMTGQEWYGRFERALARRYVNHSKDKPYWEALEAAKKASGLK